MCGCYTVSFDYAETFPADTNYVLHEAYHAKADAEWIFVEEETENTLVLQHILVVRDSIVIKHWRQDWAYENDELLSFQQDKTWKKENLKDTEGQWSKFVYQVDDSPRYSGTASWIHKDGRSYWQSTTDAPLPRREFSKRDDYNVMLRTNTHELTDYGWVHEQDNQKIIRSESGDELLVEEKGYNKYRKIEKSPCQPAIDWWEENKEYWSLVRQAWESHIASVDQIALRSKVNDQKLHEVLFALGKEMSAEKKPNSDEYMTKIKKVIGEFSRSDLKTQVVE